MIKYEYRIIYFNGEKKHFEDPWDAWEAYIVDVECDALQRRLVEHGIAREHGWENWDRARKGFIKSRYAPPEGMTGPSLPRYDEDPA